MKVWFDLLTPKQVLFFAPVVRELKSAGDEVITTSRRYREVGPLAAMAGLDLAFIGDRGEGSEGQLVAATKRQLELIPLVSEFKPDLAVSVASVVCARVAFGLGVKHMAVNDSPHSEVAGRLSLPLSRRLLCPWVIPYRAWERYGLRREQVVRYRALDPAAWLKREPVEGPVPKLPEGRKTVTVRVQESDAPYLAGADASWTDRTVSSIIDALPDSNIVVICRYERQVSEIRRKFGSRCFVPEDVVSGHGLLSRTDLFVGMGGTMTAEAALMGVPTISTFQGDLYTDRYLMRVGLLTRATTERDLVAAARRLMGGGYRAENAKRARRILSGMEDPVPKVAAYIRKTARQG